MTWTQRCYASTVPERHVEKGDNAATCRQRNCHSAGSVTHRRRYGGLQISRGWILRVLVRMRDADSRENPQVTPTNKTGSIKFGIFFAGCLSAVAFALACSPTTPPAPTAQGAIARPTTAAAQTQVVAPAQGVATAAAPTVQTVSTPVVGIATRIV